MSKIPVMAVIRMVLGALFLWSGFLKLIEPWQNFQAVIEAYRLIEGQPAAWAARLFPWAEALGGLYLLTGMYTRLSAAVLWLLNSCFLVALAQAILRKLPVKDCGCFGDSFSLPLPVMFALDLALWFAFASLFLWDEKSRRFSLDSRFLGGKNIQKRGKK